jgi:hypothetical protein
MRLISHRGNITGPNPDLENNPSYIKEALNAGYDVEVDVWYQENKFWLGHDSPEYQIEIDFLHTSKLWCHAKNDQALFAMQSQEGIHYFWHQDDDFTLTSEGFIWTYPEKTLYYNSICVLPEMGHDDNIEHCYGICSDFIYLYKL